MELKSWLEDHRPVIARRWHAEIQVREDRRGEDGDALLFFFLQSLVALLAPCLGERREEAEDVWEQATHLYGSFALRRGLSSGEVVEELQLLRVEIFRLLLPEAIQTGNPETARIRDIMVLNKLLDKGVVRASVAYLDDLFFAHLQGSGIPGRVTLELEEEIRSQLSGFARELGCKTVQEAVR